MHPGKQQKMARVLGPGQPSWRHRWKFKALGFDLLSPGHCSPLWSGPMMEDLSLSPIYLYHYHPRSFKYVSLFFFFKKSYSVKHKKIFLSVILPRGGNMQASALPDQLINHLFLLVMEKKQACLHYLKHVQVNTCRALRIVPGTKQVLSL